MASSTNRQPTSRSPSSSSSLFGLPPNAANFNDRVKTYRSGSVVEVVRTEGALLLLMEHQNPGVLRYLKRGKFVLNLVLQSISMMVMAACMVDDLQWPLTREVPVFRVASRSFIIALPGLMYGLRFSSTCSQIELSFLTEGLTLFSHYEDFNGEASDIGISEDTREFWLRTRDRLLPRVHAQLQNFNQVTGLSPTAVGNQVSELLRSIRMSDAVDLVMKAILSGLLKPTHCFIRDLRPFHPSGIPPFEGDESYPSISVFTDMIECQQYSCLLAASQTHLVSHENLPRGVLPLGSKIWSLNQSGFNFVLRILKINGRMPETPNNQLVGRGTEDTGNGHTSTNPAPPPIEVKRDEGEASNSGNQPRQG